MAECLRQIVSDRLASIRKRSFTKCFCVYTGVTKVRVSDADRVQEDRQQKKKKAKKRADKKELRDKVARQCPQNTSFEVREKSRSGPSGSEQGPSVCQSDSAGRRAVLCFEDSCDKPFSR